MVAFEVPEVDFSRYSNRQLAAVPVALLLAAMLVLGTWTALYGTPASLGIEFTGGTELVVHTQDTAPQIRQTFDRPVSSVRSIQAQPNTYIVTFQSTDDEAIRSHATSAGYEVESLATTSATFGRGAQTTALYGVVVAFVGMSLVVFALFRTFVPSLAVVVSAFGDIAVPVALMNLFGIQLSLGTVAALLMLIGYSVDSDILLTNHVLRRSGGFYESVARAMRTGVTMTVTSISATAVMAVVSYLFGIPLLPAIGLVLVLGLSTDLLNTYLLNLSLLRWYKYEGVAR
ncbi:MAG: protein translocase subunit SecF [Halobacteriaceae archaeon]